MATCVGKQFEESSIEWVEFESGLDFRWGCLGVDVGELCLQVRMRLFIRDKRAGFGRRVELNGRHGSGNRILDDSGEAR